MWCYILGEAAGGNLKIDNSWEWTGSSTHQRFFVPSGCSVLVRMTVDQVTTLWTSSLPAETGKSIRLPGKLRTWTSIVIIERWYPPVWRTSASVMNSPRVCGKINPEECLLLGREQTKVDEERTAQKEKWKTDRGIEDLPTWQITGQVKNRTRRVPLEWFR